jgi:tRNA A-37 threonylcarbamoyl transferase component Bud32/tetratricopeptide (TPR) repeat protein
MSSVASSHPDADQVRRFGLGQLAGDEATLVESHVAGCDRCAALLQQMPDDKLVGLLRRLEVWSEATPSALPSVRSPMPDSAPTRPDAAGVAVAADLTEVPAPLRDHPRYRVLRLLGRGGMGAVYLAEHRHMARLVALKVIKPSLLEDGVAVQRFRQEVRTVARLWHPNIVQADDADQAGELHFLVMEYIEGQSLHEYVEARGPLPAAEACDYARQAALGLQHAHERGLTHRDVKPHNLMRTPAGQIKILDFGLAGVAGEREAPSAALTGAGAALGTADYMAPEQARDAHAVDVRADVYALGCTLYHLLAGQPPFPGPGTSVEKMLRHATARPAPLSRLRADLPAGLEAVVARMMAREPADRYQTPAEVAAALATVIEQPVAGNTPPTTARPPVAGLPPPRTLPRSRRGVAVVIVALLVAVAGLAAAVVYRFQADDSRRQLEREKEQVRTLHEQLAQQQQQTEAALRREQEAARREVRAREAAEKSRKAELLERAMSDYRSGTLLLQQGNPADAVKYLREAVALKPDYPDAHCNLGFALQRLGQFAEAVAALKRGHQLGIQDAHWRNPSAQWVQDAERQLALDGKLPALFRGEARPADAAECLALVQLCRTKKLHAAAARFAGEAFTRQPALAEDLSAGHRSGAARSAALAGTGQGADAATLEAERARLRRQALDWLRADLAAWARQPAEARPAERNALLSWQQDPNLAGVREAGALAGLPAAERQQWRQFWADVATQLARPWAVP